MLIEFEERTSWCDDRLDDLTTHPRDGLSLVHDRSITASEVSQDTTTVTAYVSFGFGVIQDFTMRTTR